MQESGPLIALVVFAVLTLVFGFMCFSTYGELQGPDPDATPSTPKP